MRIRVEFLDTPTHVGEGVYVFDSGPLGGQTAHQITEQITRYILMSLVEMRALQVKT